MEPCSLPVVSVVWVTRWARGQDTRMSATLKRWVASTRRARSLRHVLPTHLYGTTTKTKRSTRITVPEIKFTARTAKYTSIGRKMQRGHIKGTQTGPVIEETCESTRRRNGRNRSLRTAH